MVRWFDASMVPGLTRGLNFDGSLVRCFDGPGTDVSTSMVRLFDAWLVLGPTGFNFHGSLIRCFDGPGTDGRFQLRWIVGSMLRWSRD